MTFDRPTPHRDAPPLVETASVEAVLDAIDALDLTAPWADVRSRLRLVLPRRRPLPEDVGTLPGRHIAPGIRATLGLDIGPALVFVDDARLDAWGVSAEEAFTTAVDAVRSRIAARPHFALIRDIVAGTSVIAFQSREGWASSLIAVPELLPRVLGGGDARILVPMRDLVMRLPLDADPSLATWILDAFGEADMNALDVPVLTLVDGRLGPEAARSRMDA